MIKKLLKLLILIVILTMTKVLALPYITNTVPDIENIDASLFISIKDYEDTPLENATFKLYKIASVKGKGVYTTTEPFINTNITYDNQDLLKWDNILIELTTYIKDNNIEPNLIVKTDEEGKVQINKIDKGLYLIMGENYKLGAKTFDIQDFLVSIPNMVVQNKWEYDVRVRPKYMYDIDTSKIVDKTVTKVWDDKGYENERPSNIKITLLKYGVVYDEITLSLENNWTYTWEDLDDTYDWTIVEKEVPANYISKVTKNGNEYQVINTHKKTDASFLPNTGQLWWPIPILIGVGLILIALGIIITPKNKLKKR